MKRPLTDQEKIVHFETWEHIHEVQKLLSIVQVELMERSLFHDRSKIYSEEECAGFTKFAPKLKETEYGTEEYFSMLKDMKPIIQHHVTNNRHHPEYHGGIENMTLVDLIEMVCDWKAATLRTKDGDIRKSLPVNKERFGISEQLYNILSNTVDLLENLC